jgi:D-glycero-D-manno-heptose 1,7-bisphosphate phosphatase
VRLLQHRDVYPIVCTNQSGIARGLVTFEQYRDVRLRLDELLAAEGAALLDSFACPHLPELTGPCGCRKPGTEMYERAARLHGIDLARSVWIGDRLRDVAPAAAFGGHGYLIHGGATPDEDVVSARGAGWPIVTSLSAALALEPGPRG